MENGPMTAPDALRAWLDHLAHERRLSPRTLEAYGHIGRLYVAFLERHRGEALSLGDLGTITAAEVRAHMAERRQGSREAGDHPLAARSLSQTLSAIRGFHAFLDRRLDTPAPQLALVRGPRAQTLPSPPGHGGSGARPAGRTGRRSRRRTVGGRARPRRPDPVVRLRPADIGGSVPDARRRAAGRGAADRRQGVKDPDRPRPCPPCARRWTPI